MTNKILLIFLILTGAALVVLGIAGVNFILTPKPPTPPRADTPSVQELIPDSHFILWRIGMYLPFALFAGAAYVHLGRLPILVADVML